MALVKVFRFLIAASLLAGAVSGCNGLPFFGGGDSGGGDDSAQGLLTPAPVRHRHVKAASASDTAAVASPSASPSGMLSYSSYLRRNVTFDSRRNAGMTQVYEGKTLAAVSTFHSAQGMRPDDLTCKLWLAAIKKAAAKPRNRALVLIMPQGADEFHGGQAPAGMPQPPSVPQSNGAAKPLSVDPRQVF
ncbi:MAG TPA: hypothetical protein V6D47_03360 [Oscillatoriaceae cyanobacterium]